VNRHFALKAEPRVPASLPFCTDTFNSSNDAQGILPWAQCDIRDPGRDPQRESAHPTAAPNWIPPLNEVKPARASSVHLSVNFNSAHKFALRLGSSRIPPRDDASVSTQLEYRLKPPKPFGAVGLGRIGEVVPGGDQLFKSRNFLPGGGGVFGLTGT